MGDDGIGIRVLEEISPTLKNNGIEIIFGETDAYYALGMVKDGDFLIILDSAYFDKSPGALTLFHIGEYGDIGHKHFSQHEDSFIDLLGTCGKSIEGWIIGIEAHTIEFGLELSNEMSERFTEICSEILKKIYLILGGILNA